MPTSFGSRGFILSVKRHHKGHQEVRSLSVTCRTHSGSVQTRKRHGIRCKHPAGRNAHIFLKRMFHLHFQLKSAWCASYNIPYRLKAAARPMQQSLLLQDKSLDHLGDRIVIVVVLRHIIRCGFHLRRGILYRYPDMRRIKHCNIILLISHRYRTV